MTAVFTFPSLPGNLTLKQRANAIFAIGVIASVVVHLVILTLFRFTVAYSSGQGPTEAMLDIIRRVELPAPPDELPRPAVPIPSTEIGFADDITIVPINFGDLPRTVQPPVPTNNEVGTRRAWTPFEIAPRIENRDDYVRAVQRGYPLALRNARIGGTVILSVLLSESGSVMRIEVEESSGYQEMDAVAMEVTQDVARFTPAINRDQPVSVWIRLPVTFAAP